MDEVLIYSPKKQKDPFYKQAGKLYGWIASIKFYFYDSNNHLCKMTEGTGFLNSKWTIITARHNLYLPDQEVKCNECTIQLRNSKQQVFQINSKPAREWFENSDFDLALVQLQDKVKDFRGGVFFASDSDFQQLQQKEQQDLFVAGFSKYMKRPLDQEKNMIFVRSNFKDIQSGAVRYNGQTTKGFSGSPVIYRTVQDGELILKIVGLHLSRETDTTNCKGLLFSKDVQQIISKWMDRYTVKKKKDRQRLLMNMLYCFMKFETAMEQLLQNDKDGIREISELQIMKTMGAKKIVQERQKQTNNDLKDLVNQLIIIMRQNRVGEKIKNVCPYQSYHLDKKIPQQSKQAIGPYKPCQNQDCSSSSMKSSDSINSQQKKPKNIYKQMVNNGYKPEVGQLQLVKIPETKDCMVDTQPQQWMMGRQSQIGINLYIGQNYPNKQIKQHIYLEKQLMKEAEIPPRRQSGDSLNSYSAASVITFPPPYNKGQNIQSSCGSNPQKEILLPKLQSRKSLAKINRMQMVKEPNIFKFPHNCIGFIQSIDKSGQKYSLGTGFLISSNLVLTAANIFQNEIGSYSERNNIIPHYFTLFKKGQGQIIQWKIIVDNYRINPKFFHCLQQTAAIKQNNSRQTNPQQRQRKIIELKQQGLKHNFALLRLKQLTQRSQYFELKRDIDSFPELTVCGFTKQLSKSQMYESKSNVYKDNNILFHEIDSKMKQSGQPVYIKDGTNFSLLGIHKPTEKIYPVNMGTLITNEMISVLQKWAQQMDTTLTVSNQIQKTNKQLNELLNKGNVQILQLKQKKDQMQTQLKRQDTLLKKLIKENEYYQTLNQSKNK